MSTSGREKYRTSQPSLSEVLAATKADTAVVTITEVKDQSFDAQGTRPARVVMVILTEQYPDNPYFPSTGRNGGVDRLYDKLGENQRAWIGERIALVRVRDVFNPSTKETADKFHVAPTEEWDDIFAEYDKATRATSRKAPAGKRGR